MSIVINDSFISDVQRIILEFIDVVGESKIEARTLEKLESIHKTMLNDFYEQFKPNLKGNKALKDELLIIKKRKVEKGADKQRKIDFINQLMAELIATASKFDVLPNLKFLHKKLKEEAKYIQSWNIYEQWIDWALTFGDCSYLATHIAKLTHSSSKGSSIDSRYFDSCSKYSDSYLTTNQQTTLLDTAYPDNKYSSISQLYNINVDGYFIGDLLRKNGREYLCHLTNDLKLLNYWVESFSQKIKDENKQSYFLNKQIYFPVVQNEYHLLLPLISSSLAHDIHLEHKNRFDEPLKSAFEQQKDKKYTDITVVRYPNKAYLHVTGSNHSNASSLNGKRGGRMPLMAALPPMWNTQLPSYADKNSIFSKLLAYELREEITDLSNYLILLKKKDLSVSEPKRNAVILNKLRAINSQLFNYLEGVNDAEANNGWTIISKLEVEYQLLFEPWRDDEAAKICKVKNDWQVKISKDFGRWLNQQLNKNKRLKLTPVQAVLWSDCFLMDLKEFIAVKEIEL